MRNYTLRTNRYRRRLLLFSSMKDLCKVSKENRVRKDDWPGAEVMPAAKEESAKGKSCISLLVSAMVFGIISAQKKFLHDPNAVLEVLKLG